MADIRGRSGGGLEGEREDAPGETRFPVDLAPSSNRGGSEARGALARVLVVEHNATTRRLMKVALESDGYAVVEAATGAMAVDCTRQYAVDLVLQDLALPDVDGLELVGRLRGELGVDVPILCLAGFMSRTEELQAVNGGFSAVLLKPVDPVHLIEAVRAHLIQPAHLLPWSDGLPVHAKGRRVLVVDDDPLQLQLTRFYLTHAGFAVTSTSDSDHALERVRAEDPEAVVCDVLMPGTHGFQLCLSIRRDPLLSTMPVVLVSSHYIEDADRALAAQVGADALVSRTAGSTEVIRAIHTALNPSSASPSRTPAVDSTATLVLKEHERRVLWQLERQVSQNAGLAQRCTMQAAQLAILAGTAESLALNKSLGGMLGDVLSACLEVVGISKGVLYIAGADGRLELRERIGFDDSDLERLTRCFGHEQVLQRAVDGGRVTAIPSSAIGEDAAKHLLLELGVPSALIVPVVWSDQVRGALLLGARSKDVMPGESMAFARVLGLQMAQAIGLAQSFSRLALAEERYRTLMEGAHDPVSVLTPAGVILEVNRRWEELLQLPRDLIVGRPIEDFLAPGRSGPLATASPAAAGAWTQSIAVVRADNSLALLEVSNVALEIAGEQVVLAISRDVTEQTRAQEQLLVSERMASIGLLAAGLAHEINNPLAVVVANLDLATADVAGLRERGTDANGLAEELDDAREATERVRQIALDLRLFSRTEHEQHSAVDLRKVLESTLRMAANEIRHRARLVTDFAEVQPIGGNPSRYGQVFLNLLVNAAQAIPEGHAEENEIRVSMRPEGPDHVVVEVTDTGPGIPPGILEHLFTPFFTTKPQGVGTGLGLSICERIVAAAGGDISVESRVGHGTTFRVRLLTLASAVPKVTGAGADFSARHDSSPGTQEPSAAPATPPARMGRVLVVDDDAAIVKVIERTLAPQHRVVAVTTAAQALAQIVAGERFEVILCEVMMPEMSGIDLHGALLTTAPDQADKMVFLTGGNSTEGGRAFLGQVANPRVDKPLDTRSLIAIVNQQLRQLHQPDHSTA
jgi:PAS domain S-box-containing protein